MEETISKVTLRIHIRKGRSNNMIAYNLRVTKQYLRLAMTLFKIVLSSKTLISMSWNNGEWIISCL